MKIKQLVLSLILVFFCIVPVFGYYDLGTPGGYVNDYTNTLTVEQKSTLESKLTTFEQESSNEIAVVIIDSLKGDYIENFAEKLFRNWKIGKKESNNGVLILVAINDRQMRIEVGYGLEGSLTDVQSSWIINNVMKPRFKESRYYEGIDESVDKIIAITKGEFEVPVSAARVLGLSTALVFVIFFIVIYIVLPIVILKVFIPRLKNLKDNSDNRGKSTNSSIGWGDSSSDSGGSSSSDSFGGFGGGSSGGGGASGSW